MSSWLNGEVIPAPVIRRLSHWLNRNNVSIITNEWAQSVLRMSGDGAQFVRFKDGSGAILLYEDSTRYQLVHELKHYEHWLDDPKGYATLGKLEREEFVFASLQRCNHWKLFSAAERQHAVEYIGYVRRIYRV